jgi:hypothetical protein
VAAEPEERGGLPRGAPPTNAIQQETAVMAQTTLPRASRWSIVVALWRASGGRQRRWSLALLAVLLTVGSALAFVVLWLNAGERRPVLAVARGAGRPGDHRR